jgi:hypothetical protein
MEPETEEHTSHIAQRLENYSARRSPMVVAYPGHCIAIFGDRPSHYLRYPLRRH